MTPRSDIKRHLDQWSMFKKEDLESSLQKNLTDIFSLPLAQNVQKPKKSDLVLDIVVPKFQSGQAFDLSLGEMGFPLMWRPKITISSRLYYLNTEKTKATFSVTQKMGIGQYITRLLSLRGFFAFRPLFDSNDMEHLLYKACHKLLLKMKKAI